MENSDSIPSQPIEKEEISHIATDNPNQTTPGVSEELKLVVTIKLGNLSKVIIDIEKLEQTAYEKVEKAVTNKETNMLNLVEAKFQEYYDLLEKKKNELKNKVTSHFTHVRESILTRYNPYDIQYESKGRVIEWKNMVKKKMDTWTKDKTVEGANEIIEEDETAMAPEINAWSKKVEHILAAENQEILIDKSFLAFDEEFPKAIGSICEHRVIQEESLFEKIMKGDGYKGQLTRRESEKEAAGQKQKAIEEIFKAYGFNLDIGAKGLDVIRLTPVNSLLPIAAPDKSKIKQEIDKLTNVSVFKIHCFDFKIKSLQNFSQLLPMFSNLKDLRIVLECNEKLIDNSLELLSLSFSSLTQLQSFSLAIQSDCSKITGFGFQSLMESISMLQKVTQLSLGFSSFPTVTETAFSDSLYIIRDLSALTDLKLSLPALPIISDNGMARISSLLSRMNRLNTLELSINTDGKLTDKGFSRLCESIVIHKDITSLKFNIKDKALGISDQGFSCFVKSLSKLKLLNCLSIGLPEAHITNEEFIEFSKVLCRNAFLKELSLNFAWTHVNDIGIMDFGVLLGSLVYLEDLSLNFKACSISNEGFNDLSKGITKLFNLNKLELDMAWCKTITDEGVAYFGEEIQKIKGLAKLMIKFEESKKITETGVLKLCSGLAGSDCLTNLQIYLIRCGRDLVEDKSKAKLEQALVSKRRQFIKNIWIVT